MMAAIDMLAAVRALGGEVKLANSGRLKVVAPAPLPNELIERLRAAKPDLLTLLSSPELQTEPRDSWANAEEERAAIVEYDAGAPRAWAEGFARLDPNDAPADVPPRRWLRFIDDCGRFLDGGWARQAAAFGWGPLDLFGCDRERAFARVDHAGLLWLLNGRKLMALTADTATIETLSGTHQTYRRRRSIAYGEVALPWELGPLGSGKDTACAYCGRRELPGDPLLDAAVNGHMFRAHRPCLDREFQSWRDRDELSISTDRGGNHDVGGDPDRAGRAQRRSSCPEGAS